MSDLHHFIIRIFSIRALDEDTFPKTAGSYAVINCAEHPCRYLSLCPPSLLLSLSFDDTTNEWDNRCFSAENAGQIVRFLRSLPSSVSDLYVFCDAGESRSTAVAAAILLASGRKDDAVWNNPFYHPNILVFKRLCHAFGVEMSGEQLRKRQKQSESAYDNAMKNGTHHGRWEPII